MAVSDIVQQKMEQMAQMSEHEARTYLDRLEQNALADAIYNQALEDDDNWDICKSVDEEALQELMNKVDAGNKQAMYDTAAVLTLIAHDLNKQNERQKAFFMLIRANLYVEEAQNA